MENRDTVDDVAIIIIVVDGPRAWVYPLEGSQNPRCFCLSQNTWTETSVIRMWFLFLCGTEAKSKYKKWLRCWRESDVLFIFMTFQLFMKTLNGSSLGECEPITVVRCRGRGYTLDSSPVHHSLIEASDQFRAGVASLGSRLVDVLYLRLKHLALASATLIKWPNVWCENTVNFVSFLKEQELFEDRPCWPVMLLHLDLHVCTLVVVETSMFYIQSWCQRYWILQYWIFRIEFFLF